MIRTAILTMAILAAWLASITPAVSASRVALVIGNGSYVNTTPLSNPPRDASDTAALFRKIGFEVIEFHDLGREQFVEALAQFSEQAAGAEFAVIYFAGHGLELNSRNYLIPIDAKFETDTRIRFEAVALDDILAALDGVKGIRIVLLDACRNNPFKAVTRNKEASRSVQGGLAEIEATSGTVIAYAARGGQVALDGLGRNSPFTAGLLANLGKPGVDLQFLLRAVRESVITQTNGKQEPFISAALPGTPVYLASEENEMIFTPVTPESAEVRSDWEIVKDSGNADAIEAFLSKHGSDSMYRALAEEKLKSIGSQKSEAEVPAPRGPEAPSTRKLEQTQKSAPVQKQKQKQKKSENQTKKVVLSKPKPATRNKQSAKAKKVAGNRPSPVAHSYKIWGRGTKRDAGKLVKSTPYGVLTCHLTDSGLRRATRNCSWN